MNLSQIKSRYNGIQSKMKCIYDGGCLFFCLCTIIEEVNNMPCDICGLIQESMARGWLAEDFTVKDSLSILNCATGKNFRRFETKSIPSVIADNQFTIEKWYNPRTKFTHFKRRFVDTLISSVTVKEGSIIEYYIYQY